MLKDLPAAEWIRRGLIIFQGKYWDEECVWAGKFSGLEAEEGQVYLRIIVEGTQSESLLKYLSGQKPCLLRGHLCDQPCSALTWAEGLVHIEKIEDAPLAKELWMSNLLGAGDPPRGDDLEVLRREAEAVEKEKAEGAKKSDKEKKKERKKKRKDKDRGDSSSTRSRKPKLKVKPKKGLDQLFSHTGLDPQMSVRKRFLRKAQKKSRNRKRRRGGKSSHSSSSSSSSKGSGAQGSGAMDRQRLFNENTVVKEIAEELPGTLTASWVHAAQDHPLDVRGEVVEGDSEMLPVLAVKYVRMQLFSKMAPPMQREAGNLSRALDLPMLGRVAEAADTIVQRLKSLESVCSGVQLSVANQMELIPTSRTAAATSVETLEAAKRVNEEEKLLQKASKSQQRTWDPQHTGKGGSKGSKGEGKKGKHKDSKGKGEQKQSGKTDQ